MFADPFELGGAYWSINVILNQAFCFVSVYLYQDYGEDSSRDTVETLWKVGGGLLVFSMFNFGLFLKSINPRYTHTFFSSESGHQFCANYFLEGTSEEVKCSVFYHHRTYYAAIEDKLKPWLEENWDRMQEEGPDWFSPALISRIPTDVLPKAALAAMGGKKGRRASIDMMKEEEKGGKKKERK